MKEFKNKVARLLRFLFSNEPKDFKSIPIFINNYNRLTTISLLINALQNRGYNNIHILDNKSTYSPLLAFYKTTNCKVHYLQKNYGYKAFWKSKLWLKYLNSYFVYTDSDIVPLDSCPDNILEYFYTILKRHPKAHKVRFSLKINDLPNTFKDKERVIEWESKYYTREIEPNIYIAPIDTTFALYRPFSKLGESDYSTLILRTGFPYQALHLPWYINNNNLDEEETYYINSLVTKTHWSSKNNS